MKLLAGVRKRKDVTDEDRDAIRAEINKLRVAPSSGDGEAGASLVGWKPIHSEALAVHPKQIKEAEESAKRRGVPTEFNRMGQPVFRTRKHRKEYLKAYGYHDNDGGYGD